MNSVGVPHQGLVSEAGTLNGLETRPNKPPDAIRAAGREFGAWGIFDIRTWIWWIFDILRFSTLRPYVSYDRLLHLFELWR